MRRPNGTGTVVQLQGNRRAPFAVRVPYRDKRGRVRQRWLSYHASPEAAFQALDEYNRQRAAGAAVTPDKFSITLGEVYEAWSARKYAKAGSASVYSYKASWSRISSLSRLRIRDVTIDQLQQIIDADEAAGACQSKMTNDKLLMRQLYQYALERDYVVKDCSQFVTLPSVGAKHEKGVIDELSLKKLEALSAAGNDWADTVIMLCYTGFRVSAFLQLSRFSYHADPAGNYFIGGVKTEAGRERMVPIHPRIQPYVDKWLAKGGDTMVCLPSGAAMTPQYYRSAFFKPLMEEIGLPEATPHWCRHTFSTMLHASGVPKLEQKRLLGHADSDHTEHYTHTSLQQLSEAIRKMA